MRARRARGRAAPRSVVEIGGQHLSGDIYGSTLRLTLASALRVPLALEPTQGGRMTGDGEARLTEWMHKHLMVAVVSFTDRGDLDAFESAVLERLDPPLNIAKRPPTPVRRQLTILRSAFSRRVVSQPRIPRGKPPAALPTQIVGAGPTPEELARELGLTDAKRVRGFLRARFPRPASQLGRRWGAMTPEMERAVRDRFGAR